MMLRLSIMAAPCGPCCAEDGCCLYPWPDPAGDAGGPFYPFDDAPSSVLLDGTITLTRIAGTYYYEDGVGTWALNATSAPGSFLDNWALGNLITTDVWESSAGCLMGRYDLPGESDHFITDFFASSYLVDLGGGDTGTVTRTSAASCEWKGTSAALVPILLEYDSAAYKWKVNGVDKDTDQSSPDAVGGAFGTYVVS